jgi:hypothetical protein
MRPAIPWRCVFGWHLYRRVASAMYGDLAVQCTKCPAGHFAYEWMILLYALTGRMAKGGK